MYILSFMNGCLVRSFVRSLPASARDSIHAGNVLFGASRFTSAARLSKVAYTVPSWRPSSAVGGSALGASDVVAISRRVRYIQNLRKLQVRSGTGTSKG